MKNALFLLAFFSVPLLDAQVPATLSTDSLPAAGIMVDSSFFDFGTVKQGAVVKHVFRFTNTGSSPLFISTVKTTCGCTVPDWPKDSVPPGGKGEIKVEFNTANKSGRQLKVLWVVANTNPAETALQVSGEIKVPKKRKPKGR